MDFLARFLPPIEFNKLHYRKKRKYETQVTEMKNKIKAARDENEQKRSEFQTKWQKIIDKAIFGFSISEEKERLQKLCQEKGVEHKDFNSRNLLLKWDFKKINPLNRLVTNLNFI